MGGTLGGGRLTVRPNCWGYMRIPPEHNWILKGKPTWVIHAIQNWIFLTMWLLQLPITTGTNETPECPKSLGLRGFNDFLISVPENWANHHFFFTIFSNGLKPPSRSVLVVGGTSSEASFHESWRMGLIQRRLLFLYMTNEQVFQTLNCHPSLLVESGLLSPKISGT